MSSEALNDRGPLRELLILLEEGADPASDRIVRNNGRVCRTIVFVPEPSLAVDIAREAGAHGVELIELDGGFGPVWAAKVIEALGGRVPVGCVGFGFESLDTVAAFKARYEAQQSMRASA